MVPAKIIRKIDRLSVRRNPDAGSTSTAVYGQETKRLVIRGRPLIPPPEGTIVLETGDDGALWDVSEIDTRLLPALLESLRAAGLVAEVSIGRPCHEVRHPPLPAFLFAYEPLELTCAGCGHCCDAEDVWWSDNWEPECPECDNPYGIEIETEELSRAELTELAFRNEARQAPSGPLLRAWKIEPAGETGIDALYVLDDGRWDTVLRHAEYSLEQQTESDGGGGNLERPWDQMRVTISGVLLTPDEWDEINSNND